jgi:hypothetical protein
MCLFELLKNEKELTMNVHIIRGDWEALAMMLC